MPDKITFAQLVEELSDDMIIPKTQSQEFINALTEVLLEDIRTEGKAALTNFGSFKIVQVSERTGVNPQTGEPMTIPAHERLSFTPYKALEKSVNREFEHLEAEVLTSRQKPDEPVEAEENTRLIETIISPKKEEKEEPESDEDFDDPFKFEDEAEENEEIAVNELDSDVEPSNETDGAPGLPEKNKTNALSPAIILLIIAVFTTTLAAVWYFMFREEEVTPELATTPETIQDSMVEDKAVIPMMSNSETVTSMTTDESQVIPMVDPSSGFADNPAETMVVETVPEQAQENVTITYSVSTGVWIYEIARQTYGNTRLWPLIFQANYTLDNNPDEILPNINLNIPRLEGTTEKPTVSDYARLAQAARYVADAYEFSGNTEKATAYRKAADWYETLK